MTTAGDADANVHVGELVNADDEEGLVELGAEDLGAVEGERTTVDLDEALAVADGLRDGYPTRKSQKINSPAASQSSRRSLALTRGVLLLAEALN